MYKIEVKPKAASHIRKAVLWYEKQQSQLGNHFLNHLEDAFEALSINPFYSIRYKEIRGFPMKKFPFLILFKFNEKAETISILAVFHTSKNPNQYP